MKHPKFLDTMGLNMASPSLNGYLISTDRSGLEKYQAEVDAAYGFPEQISDSTHVGSGCHLPSSVLLSDHYAEIDTDYSGCWFSLPFVAGTTVPDGCEYLKTLPEDWRGNVRIEKILEVIGYTYDGDFVWKGETPPESVSVLIADFGNGDTFLAWDLDTRESVSWLSGSQLASLKTLQTTEIRVLRSACYRRESDGLMCEAEYDQSEEKLKAWRKKVDEIKARYPWPGVYR
jgi:hypothetical protein